MVTSWVDTNGRAFPLVRTFGWAVLILLLVTACISILHLSRFSGGASDAISENGRLRPLLATRVSRDLVVLSPAFAETPSPNEGETTNQFLKSPDFRLFLTLLVAGIASFILGYGIRDFLSKRKRKSPEQSSVGSRTNRTG